MTKPRSARDFLATLGESIRGAQGLIDETTLSR